MAPCLPQCLSDLRTSFSHRHLWVIAGSIEPFPLREGDGATERGGRIMCRILDKLSGIPTGHSHCLWNLIRACHQLTFKKPSVPSIIVKSGQFWVNDSFIMMCVGGTVCDGLTFKRGAIPAVLASPLLPFSVNVGIGQISELFCIIHISSLHDRCEIHCNPASQVNSQIPLVYW